MAKEERLLSALPSHIQALLRRCENSTLDFARAFMSGKGCCFYRPFSKPHLEIFSSLDAIPDGDTIKPKKLIVAPRGIGKTSIVRAYLARQILFQKKRYIVYIGKSNTHAVQQTENLKWELQSNPLFEKLFGDIKSDSFSKDSWVTASGTMVFPRGAEQQVRGQLYHHTRPDLIVLDDLDDSEAVLNEERRAKLLEWLMTDVFFSVDMGRTDWEIVNIGSLLHEASQIARFLEADDWMKLKLRIWDQDHESLFPEFRTTSELKKTYKEMCDLGKADAFAREMCGDPVSRENASFQQSFFKYYSEGDLRESKVQIETIVLVDPAKTVKASADYSAITGVGFDYASGRIYVRDQVVARLHPEEIYEKTAEMATRLGARTIGLEVTSLNEFILHPFKDYMLRYRQLFELVELQARAKKNPRIASMLPYYRQGLVYHNGSGCCHVLEEQLMSFDRSRYDDAMDCLAYFVEMLEKGGRYLIMGGNVDEIPESEEEALKELEREDELVGACVDGWQLL